MQPMELYSDSTTALDRIDALVAGLDKLRKMLLENEESIRVDAMFKIGLRHVAVVTRSEPIEVTQLLGEEAFHAAVEALTYIGFRTGQNAKETFRAPGVLAVPKNILDMIVETNDMRTALSNVIARIKSQSARRKTWSKRSEICPKHALRIIPVLEKPRNINFYWSTGFSGKTYITSDLLDEWKQHLKEMIKGEGMLLNSYEPTTQSTWESRIEQLEKACSTNPKVTIKHPVAPHVRARVTAEKLVRNRKPVRERDTENELKRDHTAVVAPIPFVYCLVDGVPPPDIKSLPNYDPKKSTRDPSSRVLLLSDELVTGAHVYGYK